MYHHTHNPTSRQHQPNATGATRSSANLEADDILATLPGGPALDACALAQLVGARARQIRLHDLRTEKTSI